MNLIYKINKRGDKMRVNYRKLCLICIDKKLKITDVIKLAGISSFTLSSIKHGKSLQLSTIGKLAVALGVPAESLLADE